MSTMHDNTSERTLAQMEADFAPVESAVPPVAFMRGHLAGLAAAGNDGVELVELRRWATLLLDEVERLQDAILTDIRGMRVDGRALTFVEQQLLRYLRDTSLTMGEIAKERFVSINTVKTQAKGLYRKLGVYSRTQLRNVKIN